MMSSQWCSPQVAMLGCGVLGYMLPESVPWLPPWTRWSCLSLWLSPQIRCSSPGDWMSRWYGPTGFR